MQSKHFAAGLGFAFVAAWIAFGFGQAILCLVGALGFYVIAAVYQGELDLSDFQNRMQGHRGSRSARTTVRRQM